MKSLIAAAFLLFLGFAHASVPAVRIIDGSPAAVGQFPWMAAVYRIATGQTLFCGGALVSPRYVLTAGHCAFNATSFTIQLGSNSLTALDPNRVVVTTNVAYIHPNYTSGSLSNDLALIDLQQNLNVSGDYIRTIDIQYDHFLTLTRLVHVSGWGQTNSGSAVLSQELNYANLYTISTGTCREYYGDILPEDVICAHSLTPGQGTCAGDNGGPLIYFDLDGNPQVVAVITFVSSAGCGSTYPTGHCRVSPAADWLQGILTPTV